MKSVPSGKRLCKRCIACGATPDASYVEEQEVKTEKKKVAVSKKKERQEEAKKLKEMMARRKIDSTW